MRRRRSTEANRMDMQHLPPDTNTTPSHPKVACSSFPARLSVWVAGGVAVAAAVAVVLVGVTTFAVLFFVLGIAFLVLFLVMLLLGRGHVRIQIVHRKEPPKKQDP